MDISEKVAYLRGLAEGLNVNESTNEGKLIAAMIDVLAEMANNIDGIEFDLDVMSDELTNLDEELSFYFDEEEDEDDDDCCCGGHGHHHQDYDEDGFEGELYEVTCPRCGEFTLLDEEMLDEGEIVCGSCKEPLEIDFSGILDAAEEKPDKD